MGKGWRRWAHTGTLESFDPTLLDLPYRDWIEIVQLLSALADRGHQVGVFENAKMLGYRLSSHSERLAKLAERLAVVIPESVK